MIKRAFDIVVAAIVLVVTLPVTAAAALLVRLTMGAPVLFRQRRPGLRGAPFELVKFRTMSVSDPNVVDPSQDHVRMTAVGGVLRRFSIDELPQLLNVLRGDMSLVGPRPLLMEYLTLYSPEQARRHDARPGITGWSQVMGRNSLTWQDKLRLDVWYVDHQSLALDLRILMLTVSRVLSGSGVSAADHVSVSKFTGNSPAESGATTGMNR